MSVTRLLKLIFALVILVAGVMFVKHAASTVYPAFLEPAKEDCREIKMKNVKFKTHFEVVGLACVDGISRFPNCIDYEKCEAELNEAEVGSEDVEFVDFDEPKRKPRVDKETLESLKHSKWAFVLREEAAACDS